MTGQLNAIDVVDIEYLREIARRHTLAWTTDPRKALEIFAYQFVGAAGTKEQNTILRELLVRMTFGHSKETNKEVLKYLAGKVNTHVRLLAEFAKQEGIFV